MQFPSKKRDFSDGVSGQVSGNILECYGCKSPMGIKNVNIARHLRLRSDPVAVPHSCRGPITKVGPPNTLRLG